MKFKIEKTYKAIVLGGSAGSFQPVVKILSSIPSDFSLPIILCLHRLKHVRNGFAEALSIKSVKTVVEPHDKAIIKDQVYLAPANYHLVLEKTFSSKPFFSLSTNEPCNNSRPSIDITFESASYCYEDQLIGILLSGANKDGAVGMKNIKHRKGVAIVQDLEESMISAMPESALSSTKVDYVLKIDEIITFLQSVHKYNK